MDRKNLLIVGGLIGGILVLLVIGVFMFHMIMDSARVDNSTTVNESAAFNSKTPEEKAIFVARLNEGMYGFQHDPQGINEYTIKVTNVSLTSDRKYWIVKMDDGYFNWVVTVDAKTLMSKKNGFTGEPRATWQWFSGGPKNTWRSLDELKARYIAEIQSGNEEFGKPHKRIMDGKEIWEIQVYFSCTNNDGMYVRGELLGYTYVDVATGDSKFTFSTGKIEGWKKLKEVDAPNTNDSNTDDSPVAYSYGDPLRELYPECF